MTYAQAKKSLEREFELCREFIRQTDNELEKDSIIDYLIKGGCNISDSIKMVNKHIEYVQRVYSDSSIKQKSEIILSL